MAFGGSLGNLRRALSDKKRELTRLAPRAVVHMADALVDELQTRTPGESKNALNTGNLKAAITTKTAPYQEREFWIVGVGDKDRLGRPGDAPPRETITAFLEEHEGPFWEDREKEYAAKEEARATRYAEERAAIDARKAARVQARKARRLEKLQRKIARLEKHEDRTTGLISTFTDLIDKLKKRIDALAFLRHQKTTESRERRLRQMRATMRRYTARRRELEEQLAEILLQKNRLQP
jgi:hypothetical protein